MLKPSPVGGQEAVVCIGCDGAWKYRLGLVCTGVGEWGCREKGRGWPGIEGQEWLLLSGHVRYRILNLNLAFQVVMK